MLVCYIKIKCVRIDIGYGHVENKNKNVKIYK